MNVFQRFVFIFHVGIFFFHVSIIRSQTKWFTVHPITTDVWQIDDHGIDNFYLINRKEKAMLIDTGTGVTNGRACVDSLTSLPILVVNTMAILTMRVEISNSIRYLLTLGIGT